MEDDKEMVFVEKQFSPESVAEYSNLGSVKGLKYAKLGTAAKKHLSAVGWTFFYYNKNGRRESRYQSPTGKVFKNLLSACRSFSSDQQFSDQDAEIRPPTPVAKSRNDMSQIDLMNDIPSSIKFLTQLRYFAITSYVPVIPSTLGNLSNLETFIAHFLPYRKTDFTKPDKQVSFPHTLWNLKKLRYLRVRGCLLTLPIENLDNSSSLLELETLDGACFYSDDGSMEKQMKRFPNIRTLKCTILKRSEFPSLPVLEGAEKIVIPEFLSQLESLAMRGNGGVKFELGASAENLRKLNLEKVKLSREDIAVIGRFPKLEVLTLDEIIYLENQLEMQEEEFTKLRILKLLSSNTLRRWTCSADQASCLEMVVFNYCSNLDEIPSSWLEGISTLEQIQVRGCSSTLKSAVRNIEEVQNDYGNHVQVHIQRWFD